MQTIQYSMPKKIKSFEDLVVWQEARSLTREIYRLNRKIEKKKDWRLGSQITSASVSIMNNIAEGFESASDKRFANYLDIAKGSCGEVRSMLYVVLDNEYISDAEFKELYDRCVQLSKRLYKFKKYLNQSLWAFDWTFDLRPWTDLRPSTFFRPSTIIYYD